MKSRYEQYGSVITSRRRNYPKDGIEDIMAGLLGTMSGQFHQNWR
jgi:hypothetical protein